MVRWLAFFGSILAGFLPSAANAFCAYHGELYAKISLQQEYHDARWVVRAKVLSASDWSRADTTGTVYRLSISNSFKGNAPDHILYSTERNSGGFYLDRGAKPDVGGEYLLFLIPNPRPKEGPPSIAKAVWVNYNCGQSKPWREVSRSDRARLRSLSRRH